MFASDVTVDESVPALELGSHRSEARRGVSKYEANGRCLDGVTRSAKLSTIIEVVAVRSQRRGETHPPSAESEAPPLARARPLRPRHPKGVPCPRDETPGG